MEALVGVIRLVSLGVSCFILGTLCEESRFKSRMTTKEYETIKSRNPEDVKKVI